MGRVEDEVMQFLRESMEDSFFSARLEPERMSPELGVLYERLMSISQVCVRLAHEIDSLRDALT